MSTNHAIILFCTLGLLSACSDNKQQADSAEPIIESAAPAAVAEPPGTADAGQSIVMDAATRYANQCASCHGETGKGVAGNPSLVGLSRSEIQSKLETYRSGGSVGPRSAVMTPMVRTLSDADIAALAIYLGS